MQKHAMCTTDNATQTHLLMDGEHHEGSSDPAYPLFNVTHTPAKPILVTVELNHTSTNMEVDTGASASLISKNIYDKLCQILWQPHP